ncbi:transcription factor RF2a [Dendrobium catenatum]|uniref:Putative transcription factor PosF21 n=1 Tax=Dendrobium catenatum TaxID=906689 RepID=A0A2I0WBA9_9ASPA|nr:transcription factor RF2a [Dendrobium catenatum]PKU72944.1 putative transcription factor PosF21 [Dendrobium catenatum]
MDRSGIPRTPPYSHAAPPTGYPSAGGNHNQSISQPVLFSLDLLPPLIPTPHRKSSPTSSISESAAGDSFPPRKVHRRSASDIPLGFLPAAPPSLKLNPSFDRAEGAGDRKPDRNVSDDLFDAFLNLDGYREEMDSRGGGTSRNGAYSSESEAESNAIDCAAVAESASAATHPRHFRSISMDGLMRRLNFGEESARVPPSPGSKRSQGCQSELMDGSFSLEFGNGEFSGAELKKIMSDKRLEEIALADPKRAKRVLANRQSAARSKERKMRYISELERRVQTLQTEATTLSTQLTLLQRDSSGLATQNNELKIRLQSMEQQAQLRDALNEALTTEVQHLRLATNQMDDSLPKQIKTTNTIKS